MHSEEYILKPLDFTKYEKSYFHKRKFILTKQNPFGNMNNEEWIEYVESHEPHFTSEPHYELIEWEKLRSLEINAINAGWQLILRTTNNSAYCPAHLDHIWLQKTKWIFAYPELQFIISIDYTECKYNVNLNNLEPTDISYYNYFNLNVIANTREKQRKLNDYYDNEHQQDWYKYYERIKCPGWNINGGLNIKGLMQYSYIPNINMDNDLDNDQFDLLDKLFPASFWKDSIEINKEEILLGKIKEISIYNFDSTDVLPGGSQQEEIILKSYMNFLYMQKLIKTDINKWVELVYLYECGKTINYQLWEPQMEWEYRQNPENYKQICILEAKHLEKDNLDDKINENWQPLVNEIAAQILHQTEIRLSANANELIKQVLEYIGNVNAFQ